MSQPKLTYCRIYGYACKFNYIDSSGDSIIPGAFAKSLAARPPGEVRMLYQHDPARPVGVWTSMVEDAYGLRAEGFLLTDARDGYDASVLIEGGAVTGLSIGYYPVTAYKREDGVRVLTEIDLREISAVTFAMQDPAFVRVTHEKRDDCPLLYTASEMRGYQNSVCREPARIVPFFEEKDEIDG